MRLVQVTIPAGKRETILETLDDLDVDYVVTDETSKRDVTAVAYFPLPTEAVEEVLGELRDAGLEEEAYTVVLDAQTVVSRRFDRFKERYEEESEEDSSRIAREELKATVVDLVPSLNTFLVMSTISAIVATAGILLDSPAIVVGSMVIAPLIGPAMATSVGSVVADRDMFVKGVKLQVIGFGLAIAAAAIFAILARMIHLVPPGLDVLTIDQVTGRLSPDFLSLAVALGAGVAGALSLSTGVSTALVGVMIAAALIPPTAVIGIGIAWWLPQAVLGSSVLVLVNVLSINLAALVVLWYEGYRPEDWFRLEAARVDTLKRVAVLVAAIAVLSVFLGATTYSSFQTATFEDSAQTAIEDTLESAPYTEYELIGITYNYRGTVPFRQPARVEVTVGRPTELAEPNGLPERIQGAIADETGQSVVVQVRYVGVDST